MLTWLNIRKIGLRLGLGLYQHRRAK